MFVPRYLNPPPLSREKGSTPYLWYWLPLTVTKSSRDYTAKNTPFPEKMGIRMRPPHAFEWGPGTENTPFSGLSREIFPRLLPNMPPPPFPSKWEYESGSSYIPVGAGDRVTKYPWKFWVHRLCPDQHMQNSQGTHMRAKCQILKTCR